MFKSIRARILIMLAILALCGAPLALVENVQAPKRELVLYKVMTSRGAGSAFLFKGHVITAAHVCENEKEVRLYNPDTREVEYVKVLGSYKDLDTCILARPTYETRMGLTEVELHPTIVTSIGYPGVGFKQERDRIVYQESDGIRVAEDAVPVEDMYMGQIKAGMSGGPAVSAAGKLVGLNSIGGLTRNGYITGLVAAGEILEAIRLVELKK